MCPRGKASWTMTPLISFSEPAYSTFHIDHLIPQDQNCVASSCGEINSNPLYRIYTILLPNKNEIRRFTFGVVHWLSRQPLTGHKQILKTRAWSAWRDAQPYPNWSVAGVDSMLNSATGTPLAATVGANIAAG